MVKYVCKIKKETYGKEIEKMELIAFIVFSGLLGGYGLMTAYDMDNKGDRND